MSKHGVINVVHNSSIAYSRYYYIEGLVSYNLIYQDYLLKLFCKHFFFFTLYNNRIMYNTLKKNYNKLKEYVYIYSMRRNTYITRHFNDILHLNYIVFRSYHWVIIIIVLYKAIMHNRTRFNYKQLKKLRKLVWLSCTE